MDATTMNSVSLDAETAASLKDLKPGDDFSICIKGTVSSNDGGFEGDVTSAEPEGGESETPTEASDEVDTSDTHKNPAIALIISKKK